MDHFNTQWLNGDETVRTCILELLAKRLEKKSEVEQFLNSPLLASILAYLRSPTSHALAEACDVLRRAAPKETARHKFFALGLLSALHLPHLFASAAARTRRATFALLDTLATYPDGVVAVYEAGYLLPVFQAVSQDEKELCNKISLMNLLASLVFNGSEAVAKHSDEFRDLAGLLGTSETREELTAAWLRLVTAVASRSDAGKRATLDCMQQALDLARDAQGRLRSLSFAFLAAATVLKEARFAFHAQGGLHVLSAVFEAGETDEDVLRYAAQTATALAEWPTARTQMQALRPALEARRNQGHVFRRAADQLAWTP
jgi:hypothetical protein